MTAAGTPRWRAPGIVVLATGDLLTGGGEHVPAGPERFGALAVGDAGAGVTGEGVQRVPGVGELMQTAGPGGIPGQRPGGAAGDRNAGAAGSHRRPGRRACPGAGGRGAMVGLEGVHGEALAGG